MNTESSSYFTANRVGYLNKAKGNKRAKQTYMADKPFPNAQEGNLLPESVVENWKKFFQGHPTRKK